MGNKTSLQQTNFVSPLALRYIEVPLNLDFLIVWIKLIVAQSIPSVNSITQQLLVFISHLSALHLAAFDFSPNVESTIFCFQEVHLQRFLKALTGCSSALTKQYDTLVGTVLVRKYVLLQAPLVARNPNLQVVIMNGLFQKKSTPPRRKACWKISREGGLTALEIQTWRGLWT